MLAGLLVSVTIFDIGRVRVLRGDIARTGVQAVAVGCRGTVYGAIVASPAACAACNAGAAPSGRPCGNVRVVTAMLLITIALDHDHRLLPARI